MRAKKARISIKALLRWIDKHPNAKINLSCMVQDGFKTPPTKPPKPALTSKEE